MGRYGDRQRAHNHVTDEEGRDAGRGHACPHRVEGDLPNKEYRCRRAGKAAVSGPLDFEWDRIMAALLDRGGD